MDTDDDWLLISSTELKVEEEAEETITEAGRALRSNVPLIKCGGACLEFIKPLISWTRLSSSFVVMR